jgi:hydroxymethylpyrimidine/phosphomethylpyrimidine kinase
LAKIRPYVLTVAGFDPSAGAGVLADVKTFEQNKVMGLAATSALTVQNEDIYISTQWIDIETIIKQLQPLFDKYTIEVAKIGLIQNIDALNKLVDYLITQNSRIKIILDPILKATGSDSYFHSDIQIKQFENICSALFMITPNWDELKQLYKELTPHEAAQHLSKFCNVYVKGGHREDKKGYDMLYLKGKTKNFSFRPKLAEVYPKHGSGCVLSAALVANIANGFPLQKTCLRAKEYTEYLLKSNPTKLGWHKR